METIILKWSLKFVLKSADCLILQSLKLDLGFALKIYPYSHMVSIMGYNIIVLICLNIKKIKY